MEIKPFQKPHPPIFYGAHSPDSAERAGRRRLNIINNDTTEVSRSCFARYRSVRRELGAGGTEPKMGTSRFVVVADTDAEAHAIAERAYAVWYRSFNHLYRRHNTSPMLGERPLNFDGIIAIGTGIAGSPRTVATFLANQIARSGANYLVGQFAFGDLTLPEMRRSIELFARDVMPVCRLAPAEVWAIGATMGPASSA